MVFSYYKKLKVTHFYQAYVNLIVNANYQMINNYEMNQKILEVRDEQNNYMQF